MSMINVTIPNWLDKIFAWPAMIYRRHKYGYDFRRITLGEGLFTIVDQKDFYQLNNFRWCAKGDGQCIYAVRFVIEADKRAKIVTMHREMMDAPPGLLVDHKNGDTLDNRRTNLRLATRSQNMSNRRKMKTKTSSQYIGVCFDKRSGRWIAKINHNNKKIWLGRFDSEIEAAKAYDQAAKKYHGEFARLNFPESADSVLLGSPDGQRVA
jgi:hypothetical protein